MSMASQDLKIHQFKQYREWKGQSKIGEVGLDQERIKTNLQEKSQGKRFNLLPTIIPPIVLLFTKIILTIKEEE